MSPDLEARLAHARPLAAIAPVELRERVLTAALDALPTPRRRRRSTLLAAALAVAAIAVAGAVGAPLVRATLDYLGAWDDSTPGEESRAEQATFDAENAAALARFPQGTRVGVVARATSGGRDYQLLGFRDGDDICLRLVTEQPTRSPQPPECVPRRELRRLDAPVAVLGGSFQQTQDDGKTFSAVYGLAADAIRSVDVDLFGGTRGPAVVANNVFLFVGPGTRVAPWPKVRLVTLDARGTQRVVELETGPVLVGDRAKTGAVERTLSDGRIGWLDRREPRGEAFDWQNDSPQRIIFSRAIVPDVRSTFRLAAAAAEGTNDVTAGGWYCVAWLWPLVKGTFANACLRDDAVATGIAYLGAWPSSIGQFPRWVGLVADEIQRLEVRYPDGARADVPLVDNLFTLQTRKGEAVELLAYDGEGRLVKDDFVGGFDTSGSIGVGP
jgi:hypothetical protein